TTRRLPLFPYTTLFRSPRSAPEGARAGRDEAAARLAVRAARRGEHARPVPAGEGRRAAAAGDLDPRRRLAGRQQGRRGTGPGPRSEEHTSELQSRGHLV